MDNLSLWSHYHEASKHFKIQNAVSLSRNSKEHFLPKEYPRFAKVVLPIPDPIATSLSSVIQNTEQNKKAESTPADISSLLYWSCGISRENDRRVYPFSKNSSVEVYVLKPKSDKMLQAGLYHYNVLKHNLETLVSREFTPEEVHLFTPNIEAQEASFFFIVTSMLGRMTKLHGERGYRAAISESAYVTQNIFLAAHALGFTPVVYPDVYEDVLNKLLDVNQEEEQVISVVSVK